MRRHNRQAEEFVARTIFAFQDIAQERATPSRGGLDRLSGAWRRPLWRGSASAIAAYSNKIGRFKLRPGLPTP